MTNAAPPIAPGTLLLGKYRVEKVLGAGGMGVVLAAKHEQLGQPVALKFLHGEAARRPEFVARFVREAQAAARIRSEHVARVTDVGTLETGEPYLVMEHLTGRDLAAALEANGRLPPSRAVDYLLQACEAIAEAHSLGIVHRDLKPSNLFVTRRPDGSHLVKVLDFGISKVEGPQDQSLTGTHGMMGSPLYMSPEQVRSAKRVDARSDVWSLGVVLYELLSGKTPFVADSVTGLLAAIIADEAIPLRDACPDLPEGLSVAVHRCLEKDVLKRWQSVGAFAEAIAPFAPEGVRASVERISRVLEGMNATGVPWSDDPTAVGMPAISSKPSSVPVPSTEGAPVSTMSLADADLAFSRAPETRVSRAAIAPSSARTEGNFGGTLGGPESEYVPPGARSRVLPIAAAGVVLLVVAVGATRFFRTEPTSSAPAATTASSEPAAVVAPSLTAPPAASSAPTPSVNVTPVVTPADASAPKPNVAAPTSRTKPPPRESPPPPAAAPPAAAAKKTAAKPAPTTADDGRYK